MDTIQISKVVDRDGQKPWKVYDGNGVEYVTWDDAIGAEAKALEGSQAQIEADVSEKPSKSGGTFTNRLIKEIAKPPEPAPANKSEYEPSVNTGKQVVIIRQNAWTQANSIYDKAVMLYKHIYGAAESPPLLDMEAVHAIAWQIYSSNTRPKNSNMHTIAHDIEKVVRADWFPLTDDEIPF